MAVVTFAHDEATGVASHLPGEGRVRSSRFQPDGVELWASRSVLEPGADVPWEEHHGDESLHVLDGRVRVADTDLVAGDAVIVERGVASRAIATTSATVLRFGASGTPPDTGGAASTGRSVHLLHSDESRIFTMRTAEGTNVNVTYLADSTCPTCRITVIRLATDAAFVGDSHSHSEDELMHVVRGDVRIGRSALAPGHSVFVPANHRYRLVARGPFELLNYRRDVSSVRQRPGDPVLLETIAATELRTGPIAE